MRSTSRTRERTVICSLSSRAKLGWKASGFARPDFRGHTAERHLYPPIADQHASATQKNPPCKENDYDDVPRGPKLPEKREIQMMQALVKPAVGASRTLVARDQ